MRVKPVLTFGRHRGDKMTMKRKTVIFIMAAIILMVASTAYAEGNTRRCFVFGNDLMKWYRGYDRFFNLGSKELNDAMDAMHFAGYYEAVVDLVINTYDLPRDVTLRQYQAIIVNYLKEHPEQWNFCASGLIIKAIKQAYPKAKGR